MLPEASRVLCSGSMLYLERRQRESRVMVFHVVPLHLKTENRATWSVLGTGGFNSHSAQ